jgi:ubiquitin
MDEMNIDEGPESSTIEVKVENKLIDLERARTARYTKSYQQSRYPNDKAFNFLEDLQLKKVIWGKEGF